MDAQRKRTYNSYRAMKARCLYKKDSHYSLYGGRGISICEKWLAPNGKGFRAFLEDMGERPNGKTLDRVNNNEGYSPENCRWADQKQQMSNSRKVLCAKFTKEEIEGSPCCLWTIYDRLSRGWSKEKALYTPPRDKKAQRVPRKKCLNCGSPCKTTREVYCSRQCYLERRWGENGRNKKI